MRIPILMAAVLSTAPAFAQTGVLDQQSPFANVSFNGNLVGWDWAQNVQVGVTGTLEGMEFEVWGLPTDSATVNVYGPVGFPSAPTGQPAASFQVFGGGGGWVTSYVDMSAANLQFQAGDFLVVEWIGASPGIDFKGNAGFPNPMYPWELYETAGTGSYTLGSGTSRMGLNTYMLPPVFGPTLAVSGSCPGPATLQLTNLTPGGLVVIGYSRNLGGAVVPTSSCAGTVLGLGGPTVLTQLFADSQGNASFQGNIPASACGTVHLQALDLGSCDTTDVLSL